MRQPLAILAAAAAIFVAASPGHSQEAPGPPGTGVTALLDAFNECIQDRFKDLNNFRLGTMRITPASPHAFLAQDIREESAVRYLDAAGLDVVMYVGGRKLLEQDGYSVTPQRGALMLVPGRNGARLDGPILVTPVTSHAPPRDAPVPATLTSAAAAALREFDRADATSFAADGWIFEARPVRASAQTCLGCHRLVPPGQRENTLRTGAALGAVLYAYRPRP